jgi:hypothetical protein
MGADLGSNQPPTDCFTAIAGAREDIPYDLCHSRALPFKFFRYPHLAPDLALGHVLDSSALAAEHDTYLDDVRAPQAGGPEGTATNVCWVGDNHHLESGTG